MSLSSSLSLQQRPPSHITHTHIITIKREVVELVDEEYISIDEIVNDSYSLRIAYSTQHNVFAFIHSEGTSGSGMLSPFFEMEENEKNHEKYAKFSLLRSHSLCGAFAVGEF